MKYLFADDLIVEIPFSPKSGSDEAALRDALQRLAKSVPSIALRTDQETGQILILAQSEVELGEAIDRLLSSNGISLQFGAPSVRYRETINKAVTVEYTVDTRRTGRAEFATVKLELHPNAPGAGNTVEVVADDATIPPGFAQAVERGVRSVFEAGVRSRSTIADVGVKLARCGFIDMSTDLAFEIAGRAATREGLMKAGTVLLEPIVRVEVVTPSRCSGAITGDLISRRGHRQSQHTAGEMDTIIALVPAANMFGYPNTLGNMTDGTGSFSLKFVCYSEAPPPFDPAGPENFPPAMAMRA